MSYIGNTSTQQAFTPAIDYFSGNGSTVSFTLSRPVASSAQVQVVVNNVPQNPSTAFTVLNSTITFTGAPSSGTNNIYVEYVSTIIQVMQPGQGTVGATQIADNAITTAKIAAGAVVPADLSTGGPYWDTSGNVGIGTVSPVSLGSGYTTLDIRGSSGGGFRWGNSTDSSYTYADSTSTVISTATAKPLTFGTNNAERASIDSSGNFLVGIASTSPSPTYGGVYVVGDRNTGGTNYYAQMFVAHHSSTNHGIIIKELGSSGIAAAFLNSSGTAVGQINTTASSTSYATSSDYRLKENIAPMTGALDKVIQLKPCTYNWKVDGSDGQGFIAHELQAVVPDAVVGEKDAVETYTDDDGVEQTRPKYQGIDTSFLVATLTAAIKEQQSQIEQLTTRLAALEAK